MFSVRHDACLNQSQSLIGAGDQLRIAIKDVIEELLVTADSQRLRRMRECVCGETAF